MADIAALMAGLQNAEDKAAYACLLQLLEESRASDAVYPYFDVFVELMGSDNSYRRTRGLLLIAANARWDMDCKVDEVIDELLPHIMDVKPTVSRQFIAALPELARAKPDLAQDIRHALHKADPGRYRDSMAPLVQKDIAKALDEIPAL